MGHWHALPNTLGRRANKDISPAGELQNPLEEVLCCERRNHSATSASGRVVKRAAPFSIGTSFRLSGPSLSGPIGSEERGQRVSLRTINLVSRRRYNLVEDSIEGDGGNDGGWTRSLGRVHWGAFIGARRIHWGASSSRCPEAVEIS